MAEKRFGIEIVIDEKGSVKVRHLGKELTDLGTKGQKASAKLKQGFVAAGNRINQFAKRVFSLKTAIISLAGAGGLGYMGKSFIDASAEVEAFETRLISLTKSEELAQQKLQYMLDYAKRTPFELKGIFEAGVQAEAFGLKIEENMQQLGELAAFMGVDIPEAASALGRAYAAGAGAADILRERGVLNLVKDLAKLKYGVEDISKLTLPEFRRILLETISDPMGKISGATERLAKTFKGQMSMMSDAIFNAKRAIGDALMPVVQDLLENNIIPLVKELETWTRANQKIIQQKFENIVETMASAANKLKDALPNIVSKLKGAATYIGELYETYARLPDAAKTAGIIGVFMFGTKGAAVLIGTLTLANELTKKLSGKLVKLPGVPIPVWRTEEVNRMIDYIHEANNKINKLVNNMGKLPPPNTKITIAEVNELWKRYNQSLTPLPKNLYAASEAQKELNATIGAQPEPKPPAPAIAPEIVGPTKEQLIAMKEAYEQRKALLDEFALYGLDTRARELKELEQWYQTQSDLLESAMNNDLITLSEYRNAGLALEKETQSQKNAIVAEGLEKQRELQNQFALYGLQGRDLELAQLRQWYDEQQRLLEASGLAEVMIEGRNLTYREALREEYINRLKGLETDLKDYTLAELQNMLREEEWMLKDRAEYWYAVQEKIKAGKASMMEAASLGAQYAVEQWGNASEQIFQAVRQIVEAIRDNLADALYDIVMGAKSTEDAFKDMADAIIKDIARIITRLMATQIVSMALGIPMGLYAQGGILPGPFMPITPMQYGGVYSRPTLGLIAEAGSPEAVVPLKGGKIPVDLKEKSQRERPTYIVNAFSEEFMQQQINKALSQNAEVIVNMIQQDIMAGGSTYQLIRGLR